MPLVSELLERWDRDDAKEKFVNYCFDMRDTLQAGKFKEKFKPGQKEDIEALLQKTLDLLNSPQSRFGTEEDFSGMQKELEEHLTPIMMEVYQAEPQERPKSGARQQAHVARWQSRRSGQSRARVGAHRLSSV